MSSSRLAGDDAATTPLPRGKRAVTSPCPGGAFRSGNLPQPDAHWKQWKAGGVVLLHGSQLPAGCQRAPKGAREMPRETDEGSEGESARCCRCCRGFAGRAPPIWLQFVDRAEPTLVPLVRKKSGQKHQTARSPSSSFLPPSPTPNQNQPDNEVALPHPEFSTVPTKTSSRFSRCRRPSLSSKRPLRACQLPPARLQSSSLNEILNSARPRPSFCRLPPSRARLRSRERASLLPRQGESAFELKSKVPSQAHQYGPTRLHSRTLSEQLPPSRPPLSQDHTPRPQPAPLCELQLSL